MTKDVEKGRHTYLGASEVGAALGYSTWKTPYELWLYKTGRDGGERQTRPMRRGQVMEDAIISMLIEDEGCTVTDRQMEFVDPLRPWLRAHCDGVAVMPDGRRLIVEAKAPGSGMARMHRENGLPKSYLVQMMMNIWLARETEGYEDIAGGLFAVLDYDDWRVVTFEVKTPSPDLMLSVMAVLDKFWKAVRNDEPYDYQPPPEIPRDEGELREFIGRDYQALAEDLIEAKALKSQGEKRYKKVVADIIEAVGDDVTVCELGGIVRMTRPFIAGREKVDADRLMRWAADVQKSYEKGDEENLGVLLRQFDPDDFTERGAPYRRASFTGINDYKGAV